MLHFGKTAARPGALKLKLGDYLDRPNLPSIPLRFGNLAAWNHWQWGMLGNDVAGCCVWSGFAHQAMAWGGMLGHMDVSFTTAQILGPDAYGSTGFVDGQPGTDQGTDMVAACQFWKDHTFLGHTIQGFAEVAPENIALAAFIFGSCGVGAQLSQANIDQFNHAEPWDYVPGSPTVGGHYFPVITRNGASNLVCVTWGRLQAMTTRFIGQQCDEAVCQVSDDWLDARKETSPRGLKLSDMLGDMESMANS